MFVCMLRSFVVCLLTTVTWAGFVSAFIVCIGVCSCACLLVMVLFAGEFACLFSSSLPLSLYRTGLVRHCKALQNKAL